MKVNLFTKTTARDRHAILPLDSNWHHNQKQLNKIPMFSKLTEADWPTFSKTPGDSFEVWWAISTLAINIFDNHQRSCTTIFDNNGAVIYFRKRRKTALRRRSLFSTMHTRYKLDDSQINRTLWHLFVFTSWLHNGRSHTQIRVTLQSLVSYCFIASQIMMSYLPIPYFVLLKWLILQFPLQAQEGKEFEDIPAD